MIGFCCFGCFGRIREDVLHLGRRTLPADPISKTAHLSGSRSAVILAGRTSPLRPEGPASYGARQVTPWGRLRPSRVPPPPSA